MATVHVAFAATPLVWLKADAITGITSGSTLQAWVDSSGNGYHATNGVAAQRPTYVTNAMGGKPVVRFNAGSSTSLAFARPVQDDFTIVCIFQGTVGLNSGSLFYQGAGLVNAEMPGVVNDFGSCLFANGSLCAGTGNPDVAVNSAAGYADGRPHVLSFERVRSTGLVSLYVDGAPAGTVTGGTQSLTSPGRLVLGAQQTALNYFTGDIAEVQIFNTALSGTDRQGVETVLYQKYGIPPPAPTGLYLQFQGGQPALTWLSSPGATNYYVKRATSAAGLFTTIATNLATSFTDNTAASTQVYYYVVSAINTVGESANSVVVGTDALLGSHDGAGPSSRTTPIAFSEIMYKPATRTDGKNLEFIELYNSNPWYHDISGYQITCADVTYKFPAGTVIPGASYLVVAAAPADVQSIYGITNVMGPYIGSLKKSETLQLIDEQGAVLLTVPYSNIYPWPVAATSTGHSIVLSNPTYGEGDPRAWDISDITGGSPGTAESFRPGPLRNVVINEILPHSENPLVPQFIELYNHSTQSNDVSGCILTDNITTNKFTVPAGTVIAPAGFVAFTQFGFTLNGAGGTLYLIKPDGSRILDAVQYAGQADGVSYGRWPDGANDFYAFTTNTPATNNSAILVGDIVINELMYDPISENDDDQYIELYNKGTNSVSLAGWQFTAGVTFTFPSITLASNSYLVVSRNTTNLIAKHPALNNANTVGNFTGKLSHNGELVALARPATLYGTNILVEDDEVTYGTGGRWGEWSGGGGSSLELIDPKSNHRLAANWADSDETHKSAWTNITFTGTVDNGANYGSSIGYAQIGVLDIGEALVDNLSLTSGGGANLVFNPDFEGGNLNNWSLQGDHVRSTVEGPGDASNYALHLRAFDHVFDGDNSAEMTLAANSLASGQTATMGFAARWLHGWPEVLMRLNGGWLEATGRLPVPDDLGSPGVTNSRGVVNAGPAIYNVTHFPAVPAVNQPAVISARVSDPNGIQNLTLYYRLDPSTSYTTVLMKDDGTGGDAVPNDGIFSATIPGQAANQIAAFYISATDGLNATNRFPSLRPADNEPPRECVVLFGDGQPGGSFGTYHLWLTQTNATRWANLGNLSNEGIDCTMVTGNRVIYNAQAHYAGSPVHQDYDIPNGSPCTYKWMFNDDDKLLGATSFNKIHWPGNTADDPTIQREQFANTFLRALGVPWLNRRYVAVFVNGTRRGPLMEDAQTPDGDMVKEYFPADTGGWLYKVARWYEFTAFPSGYSIADSLKSEAMLLPYNTSDGTKKVARYRTTFENRRTPTSVSDYSSLFSLIDAASTSGQANYVANLQSQADMENWMRVFAANHAAGNWDCFGSASGQNLYMYAGTLGTKWSLMMFDFNIGLGIDGSYSPGQSLFTTLSGDTNIAAMYAEPTFRRMYWRALQELCTTGPLNLANSLPLINAKYAIFKTNGLAVEDPNLNLVPWVTQAASSIAAQVAAINPANFTTNPSVQVFGNLAYVSGVAPFNIATILINGTPYPLTWTTITNWTLIVPASVMTNQPSLAALDHNGNVIIGTLANSAIPYNLPGAVYSQNFDSLPNPGAVSVNANNPVTIKSNTCSLGDPFDFAFAPSATGNGGLGVAALSGWHGYGTLAAQFGATAGDQTTGGNISFGLANSSNRALGLLATSSTAGTAFGAKLINNTGANLNYINLNYTGEVWRQSDTAKTLQFYYWVDTTATNAWPTASTAYLPALNVNFATIKADKGGVAVDGTASINRTNLGVLNQTITNWPAGAALWLVWQMTDSTGKAQGLAIDNFNFSATTLPVNSFGPINLGVAGRNITLGWPTVSGATYRIQFKNNLTDTVWSNMAPDQTGTGNPLSLPVDTATNLQRYYRIQRVN
ncbi:MAG TPA: lamin tail domain-containing protein [Verrucomicrobiae bacterium]|nr:lamin tail domain-containing protein [Verrucomicrobiae bacterium]